MFRILSAAYAVVAILLLLLILPATFFPYDLTFASDGNRLAQAVEIASGHTAVIAPGERGAVFPFSRPVFSFILAPVVALFGVKIVLTKALSYIFFLAALVALFCASLRMRMDRVGACLVCGVATVILFGMGFAPVFGKEDFLLFFEISLMFSFLTREKNGGRDDFLAGVLGGLAMATKVTAVVSVAAVLLFPASRRNWRRVWLIAFGAVVSFYSLSTTMNFLWGRPMMSPVSAGSRLFIMDYFSGPMASASLLLALVIPLGLALWRVKRLGWKSPHVFNLGLWLVAIFPLTLPNETGPGYFLPAVPSLCILSVGAIEEWTRQDWKKALIVLLIFPLQILMLPPRIPRVSAADWRNGRTLETFLENNRGVPVLFDRHQGWVYLAGMRPEHDMAFVFVYSRMGFDGERALMNDLRSRRYPLIVSSRGYDTPRVRDFIDNNYDRVGMIASPPGNDRWYRFEILKLRTMKPSGPEETG